MQKASLISPFKIGGFPRLLKTSSCYAETIRFL